MKYLLLFLALAPAVLAQTTPVPVLGPANTITVKWTPPPAQSGLTLNGYTVTVTPPLGATTGPVTLAQCLAGSTANCIATGASTVVWTASGGLYEGSWGISVVANYTNSLGNAVASPPATDTVLYAPAVTVGIAPGGVTAQFSSTTQ